ncbi:glycosyltransferase [Candidatus Gottesmanbacteria bacterium]|nr:glycosyltransferase [Candidatus Gottesmanbacteria bacterium]
MQTRVLHIFDKPLTKPSNMFLGSTKDVRGRTEYFKARKIPVDEYWVRERSDKLLMENIEDIQFGKYTHIFFEYSRYPQSMMYIRKYFPSCRLYIRVHNAEFYHRLHQILSRGIVSFSRSFVNILKENIRSLEEGFLRLKDDIICARNSDKILSISEWDSQEYWQFLGAKKIVYLPYFLPKSYERFIPRNRKKKRRCICYMSTSPNEFIKDSARFFIKLVEKLGSKKYDWTFSMTGSNVFRKTLPKRVKLSGVVERPFDLLGEARAIAIFSDFGTGFKTKIIEAIACKCYILVTKRLYERLPSILQPYCFVVDIHSVDSFKEALDKTRKPFPPGNPNKIYRKGAFAALDRLFKGIT